MNEYKMIQIGLHTYHVVVDLKNTKLPEDFVYVYNTIEAPNNKAFKSNVYHDYCYLDAKTHCAFGLDGNGFGLPVKRFINNAFLPLPINELQEVIDIFVNTVKNSDMFYVVSEIGKNELKNYNEALIANMFFKAMKKYDCYSNIILPIIYNEYTLSNKLYQITHSKSDNKNIQNTVNIPTKFTSIICEHSILSAEKCLQAKYKDHIVEGVVLLGESSSVVPVGIWSTTN